MASEMEAPRDSQEVPSDAPFQEVFRLMSGYRASQALYVTATLGIVALLADGPQDSDELVRATETHAGALYHVLRFLVGAGLFFAVAPRWLRSVSPRRSAVAARAQAFPDRVAHQRRRVLPIRRPCLAPEGLPSR